MEILQVFKFFDGETSVKDSNILYNTGADSLLLEVNGTSSFQITVKGKINKESENWCSLACIDSKDLSLYEEIQQNGIYMISVGGFSDI